MLLLVLVDLITGLERPEFFFANPRYWIFPLQTVVCGALVIFYWRQYALEAPRKVAFTIATALLVLAIWISPQELFGFLPRSGDEKSFNPTIFPPDSLLYWGSLGFRFLRLAVVVPFVEEIFWRGFLLRYLVKEDFQSLPMGSFSWKSFGIVTLLFGLAHWGPDFIPALITGMLYNAVAIHTRSLSACILAHSVTNLLLGFYIMATRQWGFW